MKVLFYLMFLSVLSISALAEGITSVHNGDWEDSTTWDLGRVPLDGDVILINVAHTVTITTSNTTCNRTPSTHMYIQGILAFTSGSKLNLGCGSSITVKSGGEISSAGGRGSNKKIYICASEVWDSRTGSIKGPSVLGTPQPMELTSFSATLYNEAILIEWVTKSEEHNDYFEILRSTNGLTYEVIVQISGSGTTNRSHAYEYVDMNPMAGLSYYQLRQTDYIGETEIFNSIAVDLMVENDGSCVLTVYPNPCSWNCRAKLSDCPKGTSELRLMLTDATGHVVNEIYETRNIDGSFDIQIDKSNNLKPGIYIISAVSGEEKFSEKAIIK